MAVTSLGIKLSYDEDGGIGGLKELTNLLEIPELGEGERDTIEITTLADDYHKYTDGLKNFADSLAFKFLYDNTQYLTLSALGGSIYWVVELPDGVTFTFAGTCAVKLDGVGNNAALTYTLTVKPTSPIVTGKKA